MKLLKNEKIINIIENTLNYVDKRLINHGKRVAYLVYKVLDAENKFDDAMLRNICVLAMLHDIGAYKTEEIDKMVEFERVNIWEHSAYGYLFLKHFSPLKELAPALLFHHAACNEAQYLDPFLRELAQIIFICDRADVFSCGSDSPEDFRRHIESNRSIKFFPDVVDKFLAAGIDITKTDDCTRSDAKFNTILYTTPLSDEDVDKYLKMIIFSIESRSAQTVIHTFATAKIAVAIGRLLGEGEAGLEILETSAMLHDIGKTGVPLNILESTRRLDKDEFEIMKSHVLITQKIIGDNVSDEVKAPAVNHHEKINGAGYPQGLANLSLHDRVLAIADIISALCGSRSYKKALLKDEIIRIVNQMSEENQTDPEITALCVAHFDRILADANSVIEPTMDMYTAINDEYRQILDCIVRADFQAIAV